MRKTITLFLVVMVMAMGTQHALAQDFCTTAIPINLSKMDQGNGGTFGRTYYTLNGATYDSVPACAGVNPGVAGIWFRFMGTGLKYTISACNTFNNNNTRFLLFTGSCAALVCVAANPGTCGSRAQLVVQTEPNQMYYLLLTSAVGGPYVSNTSITYTEHITEGMITPSNQNVCYGGTPNPVAATGFTGTLVGWQYRNVQHSMNGSTFYSNPWQMVESSVQSLVPTGIHGSHQYRAVIQTANGRMVTQPALAFMWQDGPTQFVDQGEEICKIQTPNSNWPTWFRTSDANVFIMMNTFASMDMGVTKGRTIPHAQIPQFGGFKFMPRSYQVLPSTSSTVYSTLYFVYHLDDFYALRDSDPAYAGKTILDLKVVRFDGEISTPNGFGEILPTTNYTHSLFGIEGSRISGVTTNLYGTFFLTLDDYDPMPLPVTLAYCTATCGERERILSWSTYSEVNNAFFSIESSQDLLHWNVVAPYIAGSGNSNQSLMYEYVDTTTYTKETVYYRLSQTDYDGSVTTFPPTTSSCAFTEQVSLHLYPNPSSGYVVIEGYLPKGAYTFTLMDMMGRMVYAQKVQVMYDGFEKFFFDFTSLAKGRYVIVCAGSAQTYRQQVVLVD